MNRFLKIIYANISKYGICKIFYLFVYKFFLKYLPSSNSFFGSVSKKLRYHCCRKIFKFCGKNVNIEKGADFGSGFDLMIGDNSGIGVNCRVPSNIIIGINVMMGPNCFILDANHKFESKDLPIRCQGYTEKMQTIIGDDVWIGRDVLLTPGRKIEQGSIIAARCVLTKDFPEFSIIGGNPSKLIRTR